jgi:hypothetical protein
MGEENESKKIDLRLHFQLKNLLKFIEQFPFLKMELLIKGL